MPAKRESTAGSDTKGSVMGKYGQRTAVRQPASFEDGDDTFLLDASGAENLSEDAVGSPTSENLRGLRFSRWPIVP
jgi:hypothetical protein